MALVGAYGVNHSGSDRGSAYLFEDKQSHWSQIARFKAPNGANGDQFGVSVSMSGDTALVGADKAEGVSNQGEVATDQGSVYVYRITFDNDQGSAEWQIENGFDPNLANDESTLDSDNDGDLDMLEIYQGTNRYDTADSYGNPRAEMNLRDLTLIQRRSTTQTALRASYKWSVDLESWHSDGLTVDGTTMNLVETVVEEGDDYEIVQIRAESTGISPQKLFITLFLSPIE